jgi:hypothetical protein
MNRPSWKMEDELVEEPDFDIHKTRCIDSGHKAIQVLAGPPKFEVGERGRNSVPQAKELRQCD